MLIAPVALTGSALVSRYALAADSDVLLAPTPACDDGDDAEPTIRQTEGPYFTPNSPERQSIIEAGVVGTPLIVTGKVLTRRCRPVANALVDVWQADGDGEYDNAGFRLRGHQFTNADGTFRLVTVVPGLYPGRTRHIHVKVQARGERVLTTQLYFPGEQRNARDRIYDPSLLMTLAGTERAREGRFDFVLDLV
jgi:protocatechuate 3,4-dioxygenase beta subunit